MRVVGQQQHHQQQGRMLGAGGAGKQCCPAAGASAGIAQLIPGSLYFTSFNGAPPPKGAADRAHTYIAIEQHVHYDAFYDDFGPLNLAVLYRFCQFLNELRSNRPQKKIFLYTSMDQKSRVNAVFLLASYMIIYHNLSAEQAYLRLQSAEPPPLIGFRDAALGPPSYLLHVQHVIKAIEKALKFGWLDFNKFDADEYEHFERVENGDLNWIIPGKIISFCGPHDRSYIENGYPYHSPEVYFKYFRAHNVTDIVRLNKKIYDAKRFTDAGFAHHDLFFIDGSTPSDDIVLRFLNVVDSAKGAVAIHCKAGLGRTGCLIACWMMKQFRMTAPQCMGWLRVCRPGSVIGPQQQFLVEKQQWCWRMGKAEGNREAEADGMMMADEEAEAEEERKRVMNGGGKKTEEEEGMMNGNGGDAGRKAAAKQAMEQEMALNAAGQSQGDRLNEIKARVQHRQQSVGNASISVSGNAQPRATRASAAAAASRRDSAAINDDDGAEALPFISPTEPAGPAAAEDADDDACVGASGGNGKGGARAPASTSAAAAASYSSATTPIKQLKLSSTCGASAAGACGYPPAFATNLLHFTPPAQRRRGGAAAEQHAHASQPQAPSLPSAVVDSAPKHASPVFPHQQHGMQSSHSGRMPPIQKVSVSSSSSCSPHPHQLMANHMPLAARAQLHRKHFSTSRLKPYNPPAAAMALDTPAAERHPPHNAASAASGKMPSAAASATATASNNRRYLELAGLAPSLRNNNSASQCYGKSLQRQFNAISGRQQQQRHRQLMMAEGEMGGGAANGLGGTPTCALGTASDDLHNGNGCKYELRPRDQLHLPVRFTSEAPSLASGGSGLGGSSPFALTRHQKTSKSASAFFPTSRL